MLRGEFVGLNGGADFYAESVRDLIAEGRKLLAVYLETSREKGIEPSRKFSERFNVRLDPSDHAAAVIAAAGAGKSFEGHPASPQPVRTSPAKFFERSRMAGHAR